MTDQRMGWGEFERVPLADYRIFRVSQKRGVSPRTGLPVEFHVVEATDWVQVVSVARDGRLIMVDQFRPGAEVRSLEFPAGMLDPGEQPVHGAQRELVEETGFRPGELVELGVVYPNPAIQENRLHLWLALDCEPAEEAQPDDGEHIEVRLIRHEDFDRLLRDGQVCHAMVVTAWHFYGSWRSQRSASRT